MFPPDVLEVDTAWKSTSDLSPLSRESHRGQTNGSYFGRISCGWSHTALHLALREPCGHHTQNSGEIHPTINYRYKKLNNISILGQLPVPRVDEVLDMLGSGRIFSLFDLVFRSIKLRYTKTRPPSRRFARPHASSSGLSCRKGAVQHLDGSSRLTTRSSKA